MEEMIQEELMTLTEQTLTGLAPISSSDVCEASGPKVKPNRSVNLSYCHDDSTGSTSAECVSFGR